MVEEGEMAPDFKVTLDDGTTLQLKALRGQPVVVYFYPKDDTSGCTREAIDFTQAQDKFKTLSTTIIGISPDSVEKHQKFKTKHRLGIALGADESRSVIEKYGVWVQKSMYGRSYMGVERSTFLIDAKGRIAKIWRKVQVPDHAAEVLKAVEDLHA